MDSLVASAARSLAAGDPLGALKRVALREDPPALALRVRAKEAERFLARSHQAALAAGIPALVAEVERAQRALSSPSARLIRGASVKQVTLEEVEALFASNDLIVDACRRAVRGRGSPI